MAKKFEINIKTIFSKQGIAKAIGGLKSVGNAAKAAGRAMARIWNVKPVLYFRRAVVAAFAAVGIGGIKAAADMESLRAQLEAVLGDAEKAKKAFDESFDFSVATPFSPEDIVKTRIALESVGVTGGASVEKVATAAAAMGRNILDVASAVRSMETEPLRNLGIMLKKDGDKFLFEYKDKMGKARSISATGFAEGQQALLDIMGSRFEGGLQKMSQTFSGLWSTMVGNLKASLADFGEQYLPTVKKGVESVINALNGLRDSGKLKEWGQAVNNELKAVASHVADLFAFIKTEGRSGVASMLGDVGTLLLGHAKNAAQAAMVAMAQALPKLGTALGKYVADYISNKKAITGKAKESARYTAGRYPKEGSADEKGAWWDRYNKDTKENIKALTELNDEKQGQSLARGIKGNRGWGQDDIDAASAAIAEKFGKGGAVRKVEKEERDSGQRAALEAAQWGGSWAQQRKDSLDKAEPLYRQQRQQEREARAAVGQAKFEQQRGQPADVAGAQATLDRERQQTAEVSALIRAVQQGDNGLAAQMLAALQSVVANQSTQARQIEILASQIKNGRS